MLIFAVAAIISYQNADQGGKNPSSPACRARSEVLLPSAVGATTKPLEPLNKRLASPLHPSAHKKYSGYSQHCRASVAGKMPYFWSQ